MSEQFQFDTIEDAIRDLMEGKVIIVVDDEDRENEGDFLALADKATPEAINFMITEGRGLVCVPITPERAEELDLPPMVTHNTDNHGTAFTVSIDHVETSTGISAHERSLTIRKMLDPKAQAADFRRPATSSRLSRSGAACCAAQATPKRPSTWPACAERPRRESFAKSSRKTGRWRGCQT